MFCIEIYPKGSCLKDINFKEIIQAYHFLPCLFWHSCFVLNPHIFSNYIKITNLVKKKDVNCKQIAMLLS